MSPCQQSAAMPWLLPCCADCARSRQAGAIGDAPAPATGGGLSTETGALLVLASIFVGVLYGEKILAKLGG